MHAASPDLDYLVSIDTGQTMAASTVIDLFLSLRAVCVLGGLRCLEDKLSVQPITFFLNNIANASKGVKENNVDMPAAAIAALPILLVYVVVGRNFSRGLTAGAVKG